MSGPDNFLNRWSRRKRAVAAEEETARQTPAAADVPAAGEGPRPSDSVPAGGASAGTPAAAEAEFDVASLPTIESIGPETDISLFLKPGVPAALRHAALRRVWVADPAIRDFRAPQELDWDFNSPGLEGFGEIGPDLDVKKMAARIFGDASPEEPELKSSDSVQTISAEEEIGRGGVPPANLQSESETKHVAEPAPAEVAMLQRTENTALQQEASHEVLPTRRHGSALPR